jgi:hypothetical protein
MRNSIFVCVAMLPVFLAACDDKDSQTPSTTQAVTAPAKPKLLTPAVAAVWVQAVNGHTTADGSTVAQVLAYAHAKRPGKFAYRALTGEDDIGYNGATGEPDGVSLMYWIGSKRSPDDSYVDIGYSMTPQGQVIAPTVSDKPAILALEGGRQSFVKWVDEAYEQDCRDLQTNKFTC